MKQLPHAQEVQAVDARVAMLAARQHGLMTRSQASRLGATRSMIQYRIEARRWDQVASDVFRIVGSPLTWRQDLLAVVLAWGPGSAGSHRAAAPLFSMSGFSPGEIELTVPRGRKRTHGKGKVHRHPLFRGDVTSVEGIPVTTPARTLIDLAAVCSIDSVEEALDDALARRIVTLERLHRRLEIIRRPGRPGVTAISRLLDARAPSAEIPKNVFERRLLRVLRDAGLPRPALQHEIWRNDHLTAVPDFAFPDAKLAIEADSYRWHSSRRRWDRDRARDIRLIPLGWRIIRVSWTDLTRRPASVVAAIRHALSERG